MSMDRFLQLHESQDKYQRRQVRQMIKDIPVGDREKVLEKILARTLLGGDTPCKNALKVALQELKDKETVEKRPVGRPRKETGPGLKSGSADFIVKETQHES